MELNVNEMESFDGWSIGQELELLALMEEKGADFFSASIEANWSKLSKQFNQNESPTKQPITINDIFNHMNRWVSLLCDEAKQNEPVDATLFSEKIRNDFYLVKNCARENVQIRPVELTMHFRKMNGYRAARGDFETELNDKFELRHVCDLSAENERLFDSDSDESDVNIEDEYDVDLKSNNGERLEESLRLCVLDSYNSLLRERLERKRFIRHFGLLYELSNEPFVKIEKSNILNSKSNNDEFNNSFHLYKLDEQLDCKIQLDKKFHRFFPSLDEYLKYAQLLSYQAALLKRIGELEEYRKNGIRSMKHVSVYRSLKSKRAGRTHTVYTSSLLNSLNRYNHSSSRRLFNVEQSREWFKQLVISEKASSESSRTIMPYQAAYFKYKNNPLKIENYPEFEKLDEEEKEFCRVSRIQPSVYLRVKSILVHEFKKTASCSYSRARKIAGIDVNKTRLIHNLLIDKHLIKAS